MDLGLDVQASLALVASGPCGSLNTNLSSSTWICQAMSLHLTAPRLWAMLLGFASYFKLC